MSDDMQWYRETAEKLRAQRLQDERLIKEQTTSIWNFGTAINFGLAIFFVVVGMIGLIGGLLLVSLFPLLGICGIAFLVTVGLMALLDK